MLTKSISDLMNMIIVRRAVQGRNVTKVRKDHHHHHHHHHQLLQHKFLGVNVLQV